LSIVAFHVEKPLKVSGVLPQEANLRALSGRTCPRPDQAFLQRLIDYGIATGYLRGRSVQRTSG